MDRRDFLKISAVGTGALAAGSLVPASAKAVKSEPYTALDVKSYVREPARRIPVVDSADVVVVGGGPAGVAAALCAARQGMDVLLLERQYFLGGLFTGCGVTPIINMYHPTPDGPRQAIFGVCQELCDCLERERMINLDFNIRPKVDPEAAKYFMEKMTGEAGVRILYGVQAAQVVMSGDSISSVILEGKSGRLAVNARFVVDCSGDGDILEWTGEDFNVYKDDIGAMWRIGNASDSKRGTSTCIEGVRTMHTTGERDQDGLDMYNLTRVQINLRRMMWENSVEGRKEPGCGDLFLLDTPSVVGVRVTRVLNSVGNVSFAGAMTGREYKDSIGIAGGDSTQKYNDRKYKAAERPMWQIPYSSITPKKVDNLLVGGRCFGFERGLTYDAREVGTCFLTGQAAGTAAALCVQRRCSCRDLDVAVLQKKLIEQNVHIK